MGESKRRKNLDANYGKDKIQPLVTKIRERLTELDFNLDSNFVELHDYFQCFVIDAVRRKVYRVNRKYGIELWEFDNNFDSSYLLTVPAVKFLTPVDGSNYIFCVLNHYSKKASFNGDLFDFLVSLEDLFSQWLSDIPSDIKNQYLRNL